MKNLLSTKDLSRDCAISIIERAREFKNNIFSELEIKYKTKYKYKKIALLFFEDSTRTKSSFELACKNLGYQVLNLNLKNSSVNKGESLRDTISTLSSLGVKIIIIRHSSSGIIRELADFANNLGISLINAGDGTNEHPTQALLDLMTLRETVENFQDLEKKVLLIVGDCLHSRVAKSNIYLLEKFNLQIRLCGPPSLVPEEFCLFNSNIQVCYNLIEALKNINFLMALRIQKERQKENLTGGLGDYSKFYGINKANIQRAGLELAGIKILHPGPVNRELEISGDLVDNKKISLISEQVTNGLFIRMSVIESLLLGNN